MEKAFKKGFLSLLALMLVFLSVGPSASAVSMSKSEENEQVDELAEDLEFLMEEAAIYDSENNVVGFHFDKLEDRFGEVEELKMLQQEIESSSCELVETTTTETNSVQPLAAKKTWKGCMIDSLKDHFGVAIIEVAMTGGLWAYLEQKAYKEAAKLLIKIGVGGNVIGLAAFLTYYSAKCLEGVGPWASNTIEMDDSISNKNLYGIV
ncbi:hypothetical protein [Priestia filamentosa]|uniref:Uncharacterized protein n=1 Tax=Priestia filamentosa TaxID=1402861 RepID=A0A1X7GMK4_9BACI|nr:hypothetical protein [Priestia filamentosa]AWG44735.1 hypothetical protein BEH_25585 [Priestia filamentosa]SMF72035.1 hypothetical protein SAMN06296056_11344 [Priestia filamentosa]